MSADLNRREALGVAVLSLTVLSNVSAEEKAPDNAFTLVVTDPLSAPLACACVKGYAQRDYGQLGKHLESKLGRPVVVVHSSSLTKALTKKTDGKADLVIGKEAAIKAEAVTNKISLTPTAALTGLDGKTTQCGLIMVPTADSALTASELKGYVIFFGPPESEERHDAAITLLKELEVPVPAKDKREVCQSDSDGAINALDRAKKGEKAAAVIASSGEPLLAACGTVKKGDLKVVGETDAVPFIVAFANDKLSTSDRAAVESALLEVAKNPDLCKALETKNGFVKSEDGAKKK